LLTLLKPGEDERVSAWGRAIRLAQRLSGGTEVLLRKTKIGLEPGRVVLTIPTKHHQLFADSVDRRLHLLARALGRVADVRFT
jgi:exopolyphosphatase/guanosine-5'-triphosphate,3'-diphosphate pyrophosphatase